MNIFNQFDDLISQIDTNENIIYGFNIDHRFNISNGVRISLSVGESKDNFTKKILDIPDYAFAKHFEKAINILKKEILIQMRESIKDDIVKEKLDLENKIIEINYILGELYDKGKENGALK